MSGDFWALPRLGPDHPVHPLLVPPTQAQEEVGEGLALLQAPQQRLGLVALEVAVVNELDQELEVVFGGHLWEV